MARKITTRIFSDWLISIAAMRLAPLWVVVLTLLSWGVWTDSYPSASSETIPFRIVEEPAGASWKPEQAYGRLGETTAIQAMETRLSESWFWLYYEKPRDKEVVKFPSRHLWSIQCWDSAFHEIGKADRRTSSPGVSQELAGFVLRNAPESGICRMRHMGPALITVKAMSLAGLDLAKKRFERHAGLLEGGMVMLALIALTASVINRQPIYLLMSVWLMVSLRVAKLSLGTDTHWLGFGIPLEILPMLRSTSIALSAILTWQLAKRFLGQDSMGEGRWSHMVLDYMTILLLLIAIVLPYKDYLPVMWLIMAIVIPILGVLFLRRITQRDSNRMVLGWYAAALSVWLLASLYEVVAAAMGFRAFIGTINHTLSALATSIMMLVAVSIQARSQRLALARSVTMAQEEQSRLLARELHDSIGGTLTTLRLGVAMMKAECRSDEDRRKLEHMVGLADEAIKTTRSVSHSLHPFMLETLGLPATLKTKLEGFSRVSGIHGSIDFADVQLPKDCQQTIYRTVQEALANVARHSGAKNVSITGEEHGGRYVVEVQDDGKGGVDLSGGGTGSLGLRSMRERADALGGALTITSPKGGGARLTLVLPIEKQEVAEPVAKLSYKTGE